LPFATTLCRQSTPSIENKGVTERRQIAVSRGTARECDRLLVQNKHFIYT
jgi:hypothetical protein